jgi:arsenate reductase
MQGATCRLAGAGEIRFEEGLILATKLNLLYLCTGNSCRSQLAEGFTRALKGDLFEVYSAGLTPKGVDPRAVKVMAEAGIDISGYTSKAIEDLPEVEFDYVVTVCGNAEENCPLFPGKTERRHFGFDDPPKLAEGALTEEEALSHYRRVRDEIKAFVEQLPGILVE